MNITRVEIGTLNEVLQVEITPDDYKDRFESELKKVQKTMSLPGFRPGHVPSGVVKKRYGKAVLIDELNKIVSGSLEKFIKDSNLDLLGSPIPKPADESVNNFDEPGNFRFEFEIGLAPQFDLTLPPAKTFDFYEIVPGEEMVTNHLEDLRRKYGKFSNPETSDELSILYGDFAELDENGNVKQGGIVSRSTLSIALVKDDATRKNMTGVKKGDVVRLNLTVAFGDQTEEIAHMLNLPAEQAVGVVSDFNYTVDTINHIEKADLNQEFFDKVLGEGKATSEEEFMAAIREQLKAGFAYDSDMKLKHDIEDHLLHELDLKLPDAFLQKWLQTEVEKPLSSEQVEKEYPGYSRGMKLRLIENKIFREQQMQISQEEIKAMARQYVMHQFSGYGSGLTPDLIDNLADRYLQKRETVERMIETISDRKVFDYLKSIVKINTQSVSYEEFMKIVKDHHHH
jgi:trigger factor